MCLNKKDLTQGVRWGDLGDTFLPEKTYVLSVHTFFRLYGRDAERSQTGTLSWSLVACFVTGPQPGPTFVVVVVIIIIIIGNNYFGDWILLEYLRISFRPCIDSNVNILISLNTHPPGTGSSDSPSWSAHRRRDCDSGHPTRRSLPTTQSV